MPATMIVIKRSSMWAIHLRAKGEAVSEVQTDPVTRLLTMKPSCSVFSPSASPWQ